jgi:hypothetical protein
VSRFERELAEAKEEEELLAHAKSRSTKVRHRGPKKIAALLGQPIDSNGGNT